MSWPDQKETKLKDVKLKDGDLTFSAVRVLMDNKIPIDYKLTITGSAADAEDPLQPLASSFARFGTVNPAAAPPRDSASAHSES